MSKRLTILDLDRTIFDTGRFLQDIAAILETHCDVDAASFLADTQTYTQELLYDFYGQVAAATGRPAAYINQLITRYISSDTYLYPDVTGWISARQSAGDTVAIITTGLEAFQQLKLRQAALGPDLLHAIVQENKGAVIARQLTLVGEHQYQLDLIPGAYSTLALIDDNPVTFSALGDATPLTTYHLARPGEPYTNCLTPAGTMRVEQLAEITLT